MRKKRATIRSATLMACIIGACLAWGHSGMIYAKATLAQYLIADAWHKTLDGQEKTKPWSWADTWPVAALQLPKSINKKTLYVLAGASGTSLAFGPGHIDGTAVAGDTGTTVISGHRDTHFSPLAKIKTGEVIRLQSPKGTWKNYTVRELHIVNINNGPWQITPDKNALHLITCYPFDTSIPGGPLRYVVIATPE